jgi:hypothetical protein
MTAPYVALTYHDKPIVKGEFHNMKAALTWTRQAGKHWPGSRVVQRTARGLRTIWRAPVVEVG